MRRLVLVASVAVPLAGASAQTTITFDELTAGAVVANQYAALGALFSSSAGNVNYVTAQSQYNGSKPNFLCTGPAAGSFNCTSPTYVDFSAAVSGLSFVGLGVNNGSGTVAQARAYGGATLLSTVNLIGASQGLDPLLVDFGALGGITRLEIDNITDAAGIGWDNFRFTAGSSAVVPEPSTLLLVGGGLLAAGAAARRRRS